ARRPARGGHRASLPGLRPARPGRAADDRAPTRRVRGARRPHPERRGGAPPHRPGTGGGDTPAAVPTAPGSAIDVFRNRPFLLLWLAQAATQIGGDLVIFRLAVIIADSVPAVSRVRA